jgi:NAD(P)H-hydrate epimerase
MIVLSPERMKGYDGYAIETWGIPSAVLMENAGRTTYRLMRQAYLRPGMRLAVICGPGNNGGDGFVIARYAVQEGFATTAFLLAEAKSLKGDALINMRLYESMGGRVIAAAREAAPVLAGMKEADLIVDAIFGTGLSKEVGGVASAVIDGINGSGKPVIAVDIPSGLDGLRGVPLGRAVRAAHTYTYGHAKLGQLLHPGVEYRGRLTVVDISLPEAAEGALGHDARLVDGRMLRRIFRPRPPDAHKGMFGNVAVVAGSAGKTGAAAMASLAALKIGAGLVTLVIPASLNNIVAVKLTEAMTYPVDDAGAGCFTLSSYDAVSDFAGERDVVVLGPGLGRHPETMEVVRRLYAGLDKAFVIDADGIGAFEGHRELIKQGKGRAVFTPHPGEFGRLVGKSPADVNADRLEMGRRFACEHGVCLALKGTPTITFSPEGEAFINPTGNPALSKGGTGDVLTGFTGGLAGQGYGLTEAAFFAVYLHGYIADTAALRSTDMDLLAGDLVSGLGEALRDIRDGTDRIYIEKSL